MGMAGNAQTTTRIRKNNRRASSKPARIRITSINRIQQFTGILFSLAFGSLSAQICEEGSRPLLPDSRFQLSQQTLVLDKKSHLIWQRCPLGQKFVEGHCQHGDKTNLFSWELIQQQVIEANQSAKMAGWRLPSVDELATLVETTCKQPATNSSIFPMAEGATFWTDTQFTLDKDYRWVINFWTGEQLTYKQASGEYQLRLVNSDPDYYASLLKQAEPKVDMSQWKPDLYDHENTSLTDLQSYTAATDKLPQDKYANVDWVKADSEGYIEPWHSMDEVTDKDEAAEIIAAMLLLKNTAPEAWVNFPHRLHAQWLTCKGCHSDEALKPAGKMEHDGQPIHLEVQCGACHGSVAFPMENCEKCHNGKKGQ